jgi:tRNA (guanine-N7-)-methyltransferase
MNGSMSPTVGRGRARRPREPGNYGLTPEMVPKPATSETLFGNDRPLELEVGSGKGTFLVTESKRRPEVNLLGIEYARRYWIFAADRLRRNECTNARVVHGEAETFIRDFLADESLAAAHIYFPDPWPKTRHHRRRLVKLPLIELVASKMQHGARLQIATDHSEYFDQIRQVVASSSLTPALFDPTAAAESGELVGTNFERKYRKEGRTLFTLAAVKGPMPL